MWHSLRRLLPVAVCVVGPIAFAQNLAKAEEGRAVIGTCYSQCAKDNFEFLKIAYERYNRISDFVFHESYQWLTLDDWRKATTLEGRLFCGLLTSAYGYAETCQAGCLDNEIAYGVRTSSARNRFHGDKRELRKALQGAGLWNTSSNRPLEGDALDTACDAYLFETDDSSSGRPFTLSPLVTLPAIR